MRRSTSKDIQQFGHLNVLLLVLLSLLLCFTLHGTVAAIVCTTTAKGGNYKNVARSKNLDKQQQQQHHPQDQHVIRLFASNSKNKKYNEGSQNLDITRHHLIQDVMTRSSSLLIAFILSTSSILFTVPPSPVFASTSSIDSSNVVRNAAAAAAVNIASRFERDDLVKPVVGIMVGSESTTGSAAGPTASLCYPHYMEGTWDVTQTLVDVKVPMGYKFAGGPNGLESIGKRSIDEAMVRLNQPVQLKLRYVQAIPPPTIPAAGAEGRRGCVVEDRLYNTRQRLDTFAGRTVVAAVDYVDPTTTNTARTWSSSAVSSNRESVTQKKDPLITSTTFVRFKGPAVQKTFITGKGSGFLPLSSTSTSTSSSSSPDKQQHQQEGFKASWVGYETQRSLFALTNESTAPPITTDSEILFMVVTLPPPTILTPASMDNVVDTIHAKLRIVGYLNPNDTLYFDARNRAVTIQDYTLQFKRAINPN